METHLINCLGMNQSVDEASRYFHKVDGMLTGKTGIYVNHLLNAGDESFQMHTEATLKLF